MGRPGLQPREVEQLVDEPGQAARLLTDALAKLLALPGAEPRGANRGAGRDDRGQRRAQVVRDGSQQRRLDRVRVAQGPRLHDLGLQGVAIEGGGQQRLERRHDSIAQALQVAGSIEAETSRVASRPSPIASGRARRRRSPSTWRSSDRHRRQVERLGQAMRGGAEGVAQVGPAEQQARQLCGQVGLLTPALGLASARAGQFGDRRGDAAAIRKTPRAT